jgi:hypothetical protein
VSGERKALPRTRWALTHDALADLTKTRPELLPALFVYTIRLQSERLTFASRQIVALQRWICEIGWTLGLSGESWEGLAQITQGVGDYGQGLSPTYGLGALGRCAIGDRQTRRGVCVADRRAEGGRKDGRSAA